MNFLPTLEGRIPIGRLGTPKTFRVPQNTTCYVHLNINFQCLEIIKHLFLFNSIISLFGNGWSYDCFRPTGNGQLQPLFRPTNR